MVCNCLGIQPDQLGLNAQMAVHANPNRRVGDGLLFLVDSGDEDKQSTNYLSASLWFFFLQQR